MVLGHQPRKRTDRWDPLALGPKPHEGSDDRSEGIPMIVATRFDRPCVSHRTLKGSEEVATIARRQRVVITLVAPMSHPAGSLAALGGTLPR